MTTFDEGISRLICSFIRYLNVKIPNSDISPNPYTQHFIVFYSYCISKSISFESVCIYPTLSEKNKKRVQKLSLVLPFSKGTPLCLKSSYWYLKGTYWYLKGTKRYRQSDSFCTFCSESVWKTYQKS